MGRLGWVAVVLLVLAAGAAAGWYLLLRQPGGPPDNEDEGAAVTSPIRFEDVTAAAKIDFEHYDSATDMHYIQETTGSAVVWIDYDGDGLLDLFCVQDGPVRPGDDAKRRPPPTGRLYRNNGDGTFSDVTRQVGLDRPLYGMGAAVGDYD